MRPMSDDRDVSDERFEDWYPAAHNKVLAALVAYSGDPDRSADATDEAFARALSKWNDVRLKGSPTGWVFVVARNVLRHRIRAASREHDFFAGAAHDTEEFGRDPAQTVTDAIEMAQVLRRLTRRQRTMFVLHYGMDVSQDAVASLMGVSRSDSRYDADGCPPASSGRSRADPRTPAAHAPTDRRDPHKGGDEQCLT